MNCSHTLSVSLLLSLGRYLCWWVNIPRECHPPSSQWFGIDMVSQIYFYWNLQFPDHVNVLLLGTDNLTLLEGGGNVFPRAIFFFTLNIQQIIIFLHENYVLFLQCYSNKLWQHFFGGEGDKHTGDRSLKGFSTYMNGAIDW